MWLTTTLNNILDSLIENQLPFLICSLLGLTGGIWLVLVKYGLIHTVEPIVKEGLAYEGEKVTEDKDVAALKQATDKGDLNAIASSATDVLNG